MRSRPALAPDVAAQNRTLPESGAGAVSFTTKATPVVRRSAGRIAAGANPAPPAPWSDAAPRRRLSWRAIGFVIVVVLPVVAAAVYYFAIAADQYVAEFRFALRTPAAIAVNAGTLWQAGPTASPPGLDAAAIVQYIGSRAIVDELDPKLDLRQMFSRREADWPARLRLPVPIEELVRYWRGHVDAFDDATNGTIIVRVRAFTALDALVLAQAIAAASETLVNDLSARARRDTMRRAAEEASEAEKRLRTALVRLREFRDREGVIDPAKAAATTLTLAAHVRDELEQAKAERATLKTYMRDDAPSVRVLDARIHSLEAQLRTVSSEVTATDKTRTALSQVMGSYEELDSDHRFAEAAYQHALEALDRARSDADRQQVYVASFVPPSLPEEALYPRRLRSFGIVALLALSLWAIGCLVLQSVRDHLQ